jgi:hypothetical protein
LIYFSKVDVDKKYLLRSFVEIPRKSRNFTEPFLACIAYEILQSLHYLSRTLLLRFIEEGRAGDRGRCRELIEILFQSDIAE